MWYLRVEAVMAAVMAAAGKEVARAEPVMTVGW